MSRQTLTEADLPPTLLTESDGDGRYALGTHNHDGTYSPTAHNHDGAYATTGHTHAGVYAPAAHTTSADHDGRYFTESEADARFLALAGGTITGAVTFNVGATHVNRLTVAGGVQPKITVASSAPSSPATGDLWIW